MGSRALNCAIASGLKMKEDPVSEKIDPGSLFTSDPDEPPSWKYHHGCVMFLSRPDRLKSVSAGLKSLQDARELKRQASAPSVVSSPRKNWQTGIRRARMLKKS